MMRRYIFAFILILSSTTIFASNTQEYVDQEGNIVKLITENTTGGKHTTIININPYTKHIINIQRTLNGQPHGFWTYYELTINKKSGEILYGNIQKWDASFDSYIHLEGNGRKLYEEYWDNGQCIWRWNYVYDAFGRLSESYAAVGLSIYSTDNKIDYRSINLPPQSYSQSQEPIKRDDEPNYYNQYYNRRLNDDQASTYQSYSEGKYLSYKYLEPYSRAVRVSVKTEGREIGYEIRYFNTNNILVKKEYYNSFNVPDKEWWYFDENGRLNRVDEFANGSLNWSKYFSYNEKNQIIKADIFDPKGTQKEKWTYTYRNDGSLENINKEFL